MLTVVRGNCVVQWDRFRNVQLKALTTVRKIGENMTFESFIKQDPYTVRCVSLRVISLFIHICGGW